MSHSPPATSIAARSARTAQRASAAGGGLGRGSNGLVASGARFLDATLEVAIASFALWTVLYHLALAAGLGASLVWWLWVLGTVGVVALRARMGQWIPPVGAPHGHGAAMAVAAGFAVLSSVIVRPDLDDASYVVRATWVAARGVLDAGDVIFSDGAWPGIPEQTPNVASFETLLGMLSRASGVSAGSLIYVVFVPLASFGAVWALWTLVRAWRVRRPLGVLVLAAVFLLWGGGIHASWGNLHLARIWQGKVTFLALLVPLLYAWAARYWSAPRGARRWVVVGLLFLGGIASVGLTTAAVFVVPGVVVIAAFVGLVTHRVRAAMVLVVAGALYPLAAGVVIKLAGHTSSAVPGFGVVGPWEKTLGTGIQVVVVVVAAILAVLAMLEPRLARTHGPVGTLTAGASALVGAVIAIPSVSDAAAAVMGTDAIAWRIAWVVPVTMLVGMVASPGRHDRGYVAAGLAVVTAGAMIVGGLPLWSTANAAALAPPTHWKMWDRDLATGTWIVDRRAEGRYLARSEVVAAVGALTADRSPVGSRSLYMVSYDDVPGAQNEDRRLLQDWVDGAAIPTDPVAVAGAVDALDVRIVCGPATMADLLGGAWTIRRLDTADTCWTRG